MNEQNQKLHIDLLNDAIFDSGRYAPDGLPVIRHLRNIIPLDWRATLVVVDDDETVNVWCNPS